MRSGHIGAQTSRVSSSARLALSALGLPDAAVYRPAGRAERLGDAVRPLDGDVVRPPVHADDVGFGAVRHLGREPERASRIVSRSANVPGPSGLPTNSHRGAPPPLRTWQGRAASVSVSEPETGHQNSSASVWTTQSASSSVAARPRHLRQPSGARGPVVGPRLVDHRHQSGLRVATEDPRGLVGGAVVGDDEVVHAERVVKAQVASRMSPSSRIFSAITRRDRRTCRSLRRSRAGIVGTPEA